MIRYNALGNLQIDTFGSLDVKDLADIVRIIPAAIAALDQTTHPLAAPTIRSSINALCALHGVLLGNLMPAGEDEDEGAEISAPQAQEGGAL